MPHWSFWSTEAEAVHGISREHIECHGLWPETIASKLNNILRGETVYCDSVAWDGFWLNVLFSDCAIHCEFKLFDIQELLLDSDSALEKYVSERQQLVDSGDFREHRALDDARMTLLALQKALSGR